MKKSYPSQRIRAFILILYLGLLFFANYLAFDQILPVSGGKGLWFYTGLASILLANLLVTPFYTKPVDSIAYSVAAIVALYALNDWTQWGNPNKIAFLISILFCLIVLILSFLTILGKDARSKKTQEISNSIGIIMKRIFLAVFVLFLLFLCSCSSTGYIKSDNKPITTLPNWQRIGKATVKAVTDPYTWVPATGAAVFGITNLDKTVSDRARENTYLFGSNSNADEASDHLRMASKACWITTLVLIPTYGETEDRIKQKLGISFVEWGATIATHNTTGLIKGASQRERPNSTDNRSFPSGHTSSSAVFTSLARQNIDHLALNPSLRQGLYCGLSLLTAGTSWARVEAAKHYPSDVLFGAALGNFFSVFLTESFLKMEDASSLNLSLVPTSQYIYMSFNYKF